MKKLLICLAILGLLGLAPTRAEAGGFFTPVVPKDEAILVIGASLENGGSPCMLNLDGSGVENNTLFCGHVNFGSYMPLAAALQNRLLVKGQVIDEAIGGATTFPRSGFPAINPDGTTPDASDQTPFGWEQYGYNQQFVRAISQVLNPLTEPPTLAARYILIGIPNDCLHSSAFPVSPAETVPDQCGLANPESGKTGTEELVDRLIGIGQVAISFGLTPIYTGYPQYADPGDTNGIDLNVAQALFGFPWVMSETSYNTLKADYDARIPATLGPGNVIMADAWSNYEHLGDGLHPSISTSEVAALRVVLAIKQFEN